MAARRFEPNLSLEYCLSYQTHKSHLEKLKMFYFLIPLVMFVFTCTPTDINSFVFLFPSFAAKFTVVELIVIAEWSIISLFLEMGEWAR